MRKLLIIELLILVLGVIATLAGIGTSSELFMKIKDATVDAFYYLENHGIPVEFTVFLLMIVESAGIRVPSEVVMPLGGFLAALGFSNFRYIVLAGALGNVVGSLIAYYLGIKGFTNIFDRRFRYIRDQINRRGNLVTLITRVTPGIRTYAPFALGAARVNLFRFIIYTFIGSFIRCIPRTYIGYEFGAERDAIIESTHRYTPLILAILVDILLLALFYEKT